MEHPGEVAFTQFAARSKPLYVGLAVVLIAESVGLHAVLYERRPALSVALLALNLATFWWLARMYRLIGERPIVVRERDVLVRFGSSVECAVPFTSIRGVRVVSWKEVPPESATRVLRLSGADDPNVVLQVDPPVRASLVAGFSRSVATIALRLDAPEAFVRAVQSRLADAAPGEPG